MRESLRSQRRLVATAALTDETVASSEIILAGDERVRFGVGGAAIDHGLQIALRKTGILQIGKLGAGKNGLACGAAMSYVQNDCIGNARQAQNLSLAAPGIKLVQAVELKHGTLGQARGDQSRDGLSIGERQPAAPRQTHQFDAISVGYSCLARDCQLLHFRIGHVEIAKLVDTVEPHPRFIERGHVRSDESSSGNRSRQEAPRVASAGKTAAAETGLGSSLHTVLL